MRRQHVDLRDTVRLVDSRYDASATIPHAFDELTGGDAAASADLVDLVQLTSARIVAEEGDSPHFPRNLLVAGVPMAGVINAAFAHPAGAGQGGGRFSDEHVGAWYAGEDVATARAEVAHHRRRFLRDAGITEARMSFTPYFSDVNADAYVLARTRDGQLLAPDSYGASQAFARACLAELVGVIRYPSVRATGGSCVAILVPHLVQNVRRGPAIPVSWADGTFTWGSGR